MDIKIRGELMRIEGKTGIEWRIWEWVHDKDIYLLFGKSGPPDGIDQLENREVVASGIVKSSGEATTLIVESLKKYVGTKLPHDRKPLLEGLEGSSADLIDEMDEEEEKDFWKGFPD